MPKCTLNTQKNIIAFRDKNIFDIKIFIQPQYDSRNIFLEKSYRQYHKSLWELSAYFHIK